MCGCNRKFRSARDIKRGIHKLRVTGNKVGRPLPDSGSSHVCFSEELSRESSVVTGSALVSNELYYSSKIHLSALGAYGNWNVWLNQDRCCSLTSDADVEEVQPLVCVRSGVAGASHIARVL